MASRATQQEAAAGLRARSTHEGVGAHGSQGCDHAQGEHPPSLAGRSPCPGGRSRAGRSGSRWAHDGVCPPARSSWPAPAARAEDTLMSSWSPGAGRTAWHEHGAHRSEPHQLNLRVLAVRTPGTSVVGPSREPRHILPAPVRSTSSSLSSPPSVTPHPHFGLICPLLWSLQKVVMDLGIGTLPGAIGLRL